VFGGLAGGVGSSGLFSRRSDPAEKKGTNFLSEKY
jgi:hypothetical protein